MEALLEPFIFACFCNFCCCLYPMRHTYFTKTSDESLYQAIKFNFFSMCLWLSLALQSADLTSIIGNALPTVASGINLFLCGTNQKNETRVLNDLFIGFTACVGCFLIPLNFTLFAACGITFKCFLPAWGDSIQAVKREICLKCDVLEYGINLVNCSFWMGVAARDADFIGFSVFASGALPCAWVVFCYFNHTRRSKSE